jgi:isoamylase
MGMLLDGRAQATGIKRPSMDATALLVLNAHHDVVKFRLPEVVGGQRWRRLLDTNIPDSEGAFAVKSDEEYVVTARSLVLFAVEADHRPSVALRRARLALRQLAETPATVPSANGDAPSEQAHAPAQADD